MKSWSCHAQTKVEQAVDVVEVEHFMKAGFSVTFVGPEDEITSGGVQAKAEAGESRGEGGPGVEAKQVGCLLS